MERKMAKQHSRRSDKGWQVSFWLVFDAWGAVRLTRGEPDLKNGERGMAVTALIPHALFNIPQLRATLNVTAPDAPPIQLDADAAAEALKLVVGADINIRVTTTEGSEDDGNAA
jgi:hypothetical protein